MALKDSLRLESVYFNTLKSRMKLLKTWADGESSEETIDILNNCIEADAAILLLYRNLGETWNELTAYIQKEMHDLNDLKDQMEAYHDELNEKIDEVNNYLMALIRELQERVSILENKVEALEDAVEGLSKQINIVLDLVVEEVQQTRKGKKNTKAVGDPVYHLEYYTDTVSYVDITAFLEAGPDRVLWVKVDDFDYLPMGETSSNVYTFTRTTYDSTNSQIVKHTVTIDNTDAVTYTEETGSLGGGGVSDFVVCKCNFRTGIGAVTFNVTPADVALALGDNVFPIPFSAYIYDAVTYYGGAMVLTPIEATFQEVDPEYPDYREFHFKFMNLHDNSVYDFDVYCDGSTVQSVTVSIAM